MTELSIVVKATVILVIALGATACARRAPAALRALILTCAFGVLLALPLTTIVPLGSWDVAVPPAAVAPFVPDVSVAVGPSDIAVPARSSGTGSVIEDPPLRTASVAGTARTIWIVGALLVAVRIGVGLLRVSRIRRQGVAWAAGREAFPISLGRTNASSRVAVFLHPALESPMTCGVLRPAIGLPMDAPKWPGENVRRALVHENQHVRRRDWVVQLAAEVACAAYWFHPLVWVALRQMRLESERACDDAVVRSAEGSAYAQQLVELARRLSARQPAALLSMVQRGSLTRRVRAVLDPTQARGEMRARTALATLSLAIGFALGIAPLRVVAGQTTEATEASAPGSTFAPQASQTPSSDVLTFEVASIRPSGLSFTAPADSPNRFSQSQMTVLMLVQMAYRGSGQFLPLFRIEGGPAWIREERFDVHATTSAPATDAQKDLMLQNLLIERLGLSSHWDSRTVPGYALVFSREDKRLGPNLRRSDFDCAAFLASGKTLADVDAAKAADGLPICYPRDRPDAEGRRRVELGGTTMLEYSEWLSIYMRRPVVDRTGVPGTFDFDVTYVSESELLRPDRFTPVNGVSFSTALQEQLGLKLEPIREAPLRVLVIDSVQKPTPN